MSKELSIEELMALAEQQEDQSIVTAGGDFENEVAVAGPTVVKFIDYIEVGKQDGGAYQGKKKPDVEKAFLGFELLTQKHAVEYEHEGVKHKRQKVTTIRLGKKFGEKASFKKVFNQMDYGRGIKHFAKMLGEQFRAEIYHNTVKGQNGAKDTVYANLNNADGVYSFSAPKIVDPITGDTTIIPAQESFAPLRLFLWDHPTPATWASLFIDGTREVKDDKGVVTQVSKNWLQEYILGAKNFKGSALDQMLNGVSDLPASEEEMTLVEAGTEKAPQNDNKPAVDVAAASSTNDALAALGLVAA